MKKFLSVVMSCAVFATSFGNVVHANPSVDSSSYSSSVGTKNNKKGCLDNYPKLKKFLKLAGLTAGCIIGSKLLSDCGKELVFIAQCDFLSRHPELLDKDLTKIENKRIYRQEGKSWCWNACLTRVLYKQGLKDVTQKKVYKAMGGSRWWISPWRAKRNQGGVLSEDESRVNEKMSGFGFILRWMQNPVYRDQIESGVAKLSDGKLKYQNVNLPWEKLKLDKNDRLYSSRVATKFLGRLLNKVRENNKDAVIMTMCPFSPSGHAVTVENVNDRQIIFGEPTTGLVLGMPCDKFFDAKKSCLRDKFPNDSLLYEAGLCVGIVVRNGQELSEEWVSKMIDEVVKEAEESVKTTTEAKVGIAA